VTYTGESGELAVTFRPNGITYHKGLNQANNGFKKRFPPYGRIFFA
jgi:hypothetical protein